jgi:phage-related protein
MAAKNLIVRGGADFSGIKKELDKTQKQLQGFKSNVNSAMKKIGAILGTLAIGKLIKDSTQVAMTVESSINQINRTMGNNAAAFQQWVNAQSQGFGMAKSEAYKFGATYSNLISGFSSGTGETAKRTQDLLQTTAVIASATGRSFEDTSDRIRSGLLGSTEAIEDLGININVAMLESTEAFRRFAGDSSWQQLSFQTQQNIRLAAIMEQAYTKYGNTLADTTATRQMQFVASLRNIQYSLGQAFLPIYNAVLPYLTAMANAITKVVNLIAQFTTALFGSAKTGKTQAAAVSNQVSGMKDLGTATTGAGKAAKKAAKDAKGALAGFDEINQLSQNTGSAGDGAGGGAAGGGPGGVSMPALDEGGGFASATVEVSEKVKKMAENIKKAFEDIGKTIKKYKNQIVSSLAGIGAGILTYLIGNNWGKVVKVISGAMQIIIKALGGINLPLVGIAILIALFVKAVVELWQENKEFRDNIIKAWNGIKDTFTKIWNTILKPIFKAFVDMLLDIWNDGIKPLWGKWKEFVKQIVLLITDLWNGMKPVVDWIVKTFGPVIVNIYKFVFDNIKKYVLLIIGIVSDILTALTGTITGIRQIFKGLIDFVAGVFTGDWSRAWNGVKNIFSGVKTAISSVWTGIKSIFGSILTYVTSSFKNTWNSAWNGMKNIFSTIFNSLKSIGNNALNNVKNVISPIVNSIKSTISGIKSTFSSVFNSLKSTASSVWNSIKNTISGVISNITSTINGIKTTFSSVFNSLKTIIKAPLNSIINSINNSLGKINITIPSWVPGLGGKGFSIPKIPHLAKGGITGVNNPFAAVVGDNKTQREVVSPLDDLLGMISGAVGTAVLGAMQFSNGNRQGANNSGDIILKLDGTTLGRVIKPYLEKEEGRTGTNLIIKTT